MIKVFRESFENEEGQAIVIGALMMLILAFGLVVTLNLGKAVEEKINLQNNSDAAAYSLAVVEAQAFNYIAFTNRVQAAHYNMIMTVQTYQSMILLIESVLGAIYDFFFTLYGIFFWVKLYNIDQIIKGIAQGYGTAMKILRLVIHGAESGKPKDFGAISILGFAKQAIWYVNYAHYFANLVVAGSVWLKILNNMHSVRAANDPRLSDGLLTRALNVGFNGFQYLKTFDKYAGGIPPIPSFAFNKGIEKKSKDEENNYNNPYTRSDEARFRQQLMGEIANASRSNYFNTSSEEKYGIDNIFIFKLETVGASKLLGVSPRILQKNNEMSPGFYNMGNTASNGQHFTKGVIPELRFDKEERSTGSWGDIVASDKGYQITIGFGFEIPLLGWIGFKKSWGQGTYIWSDNHGGNYWRWRAPDKNNTGICLKDNNKCLDRQRSDITKPTIGYIRMSVSLWTLLGTVPQTFINHLRKYGLTFYTGCDLEMTSFGAGGDNWDREDFGAKVDGFNRYKCHNRGSCKWPFYYGCCVGLAEVACELQGKLKKRLQTHEYISKKSNGKQYYFGISPFVKFLPDSKRLRDFNQPSTWSFMNLPAEEFMKGNPWNLEQKSDIVGTQGNTPNSNSGSWSHHEDNIDSNIGTEEALSTDPIMPGGDPFSKSKAFKIFSPGFNVMSRARVYYHRPDNWNEHPNFFNPYWRAQLAPIAPKLSAFVTDTLGLDSDVENESGISGQLGSFFSSINSFFVKSVSRIITH